MNYTDYNEQITNPNRDRMPSPKLDQGYHSEFAANQALAQAVFESLTPRYRK